MTLNELEINESGMILSVDCDPILKNRFLINK